MYRVFSLQFLDIFAGFILKGIDGIEKQCYNNAGRIKRKKISKISNKEDRYEKNTFISK